MEYVHGYKSPLLRLFTCLSLKVKEVCQVVP